MVIREAAEEDVEGIARAWIASWRWAFAGILPTEFIEARSDLDRRMDNVRADQTRGPMLVADEAGILGFATGRAPASLAEFDAEIAVLYLRPDAARKGVGRALAQRWREAFSFGDADRWRSTRWRATPSVAGSTSGSADAFRPRTSGAAFLASGMAGTRPR